jgi:PAS domain S-box-containing protein
MARVVRDPFPAAPDAVLSLAAIVEGCDDAIVSKTLDGVILTWNPAAERLFGWRAEEVVGRSMEVVIPPERLEEERQILARIRLGQRVAHLETERLARRGTRIPVSVSISPVRSRTGAITGASTIMRDISERKLASDALRESEERYRSVFEGAAVGVGRVALDGTFLELNEAYARILGYAHGELVGRKFQDVTHPEDLPADIETLAALEAGRIPSYQREKRYVRKNGELVWVSVSVGLARDRSGRPAYCSSVVEDITSRKHAEQALRDSEQALRETADRFEMLAHSVPQLVWMADDTGALLWFNRRCFEYTGLTLEELRGWEWQRVVHPDHAARVVRALREHVERGEAKDDMFPVRRWSGEYRWFLTRSLPIRDERGRVVRWLGTGTDVTEQHEGERRKDEFLAMLSHELRNPLAPIRNCTSILRRADPASDQARRARAVIERQSAHLGRLVDDLLDVTRIARGKIELRRQRVDLRDVAMRAADDLQTFMHERGLELRVDVAPAPAWADADATRVTQVIGNLLHNAAKFTNRGGTIELALRRADDHAEISVRDTGAGIDGALLPRLFDAYVQGERTRARSEGGLGLGLALV